MSVRVVERRHDLFMGESWGARCLGCGAWLSKYDETTDEARRGGELELLRHLASCPSPHAAGQSELPFAVVPAAEHEQGHRM